MPTDTSAVDAQLRASVQQAAPLSRTGLLERIFARLFNGLVYAQIWEDPAVDMDALDIQEGDHLVVIASGGCNAMSYLTKRPGSVTAVDLSPAHVALSRLKAKAAEVLPDHQTFYNFFGHANRADNIRLYDAVIAPQLDPETRAYWSGRTFFRRRVSAFSRGFYRFGLLGRFIAAAHLLARFSGKRLSDFTNARTIADQEAYFNSNVAPLFDSRIVRFLARQRASLFGLGIPPEQYDKLAADGGGDVLPVLKERTRKLMCDFPLSENYFAWAAFARGYKPDGTGPVPPYLEGGNHSTIKAMASRYHVHNRTLTDLLSETAAGSKNGFVLLDAQDWMNDEQLNALWSEITRTAATRATVIFRTGGAADILPGRVRTEILSNWTYDAAASAVGTQNDRSAIYGGFHVYRRVG